MTADILSKIIDIGLSKKLDKLELSTSQHCSDIILCEGLVDQINSNINH